MDIRQALVDAVRRADRAGANALLEEWEREHGHARLLGEVLEPTLRAIGEEWSTADTFTVAQVYVAAKVAGDALQRIAERAPRSAAPASRGAVIIGNVEEDFHSLGRRLLGTFLSTEGWSVRDLGNDVPAGTFVDEALAAGARVIGVSAMMLTTARNIARVREEIDRRGLRGRLQLAVGGAVFLVRPGLVEEVGGDGTASNALGAAELFERLWARSLAAEGA
ncbi:cobalamin B12-binding domain-containing protein [Anaeromyxobacter paludicola]|uniref:Corrinoid-binding protein n=1 Tax=Anaeromyxobacter paludicola TaxID=2918171 RepID=A0ABM7XAI4_9BACT|nr:cobalamin-dependent protein [Anaeromyxobacter paludicola]BDG08825.1 corrinoid-binding protein [Anaeromyxobacter paludicola]